MHLLLKDRLTDDGWMGGLIGVSKYARHTGAGKVRKNDYPPTNPSGAKH
jgi:hypothetical protein